MEKFDLKYFLLSILFLIGFAVTHIFYCHVMFCIKWILTLPYLNLYAGGVATIFTVLPKVKTGKISFHAKMSFEDFRASISDIISFIDNPIVIVGALGLAKGLFLYYYEHIPYFPYLNSYEIALVLLVTLYLLYTSLLELWNNMVKTWWTVATSNDTPHASTQEEIKGKEVPKPEK